MSFPEAHKQWLDGGVAVPERTGYSHTDTDPANCPACKARTEQAYAESAALLDGHRAPADAPGIYETLAVISAQLGDLLALQRRMLAAMGSSSDSRSSVELKVSSARGAPDPTVKVYAGSPIEGLVDIALDEFGRLKREADARAMQGWAETLEQLGPKPPCGASHWHTADPRFTCELPVNHAGQHGFNT